MAHAIATTASKCIVLYHDHIIVGHVNFMLIRLYCSSTVPEQAVDYLGGAVQNLAAHNFKGDEETEPPTTTGAAGWKGDIHGRKSDG